jgi:hypothetical protein
MTMQTVLSEPESESGGSVDRGSNRAVTPIAILTVNVFIRDA